MLRQTKRLMAGVVMAAVWGAPLAAIGQVEGAGGAKPATLSTTSATTTATTVATTAPAQERNAALAERIAYGMAQGLLRARPIVASSWPATVALLEASYRLNPDEPRIQRMLVEALLREGNGPRALEILGKYRATEEGKEDHGAQIQTIDLYLSQVDTAEKQIEYLKDVVGRSTIPETVRSYCALRAGELLSEHMQDEESMQMVDQALRLNPLNLRALQIKYETLKNGTPSEKLAGMLAMLKSNPAQPALTLAVAQDLADAGLVQPALQWYTLALNMYPRTEMRTPGRETVVDYAAEIYIGGDPKNADGIAQRITGADTDSLNAWLLRLIVTRAMGDKEALGVVSRQTAISLTNRLAMMKRGAGDATATTQPVDATGEVPAVDVTAELNRFQKANNPQLIDQFTVIAQTMAWVKIYFDEKPADAEPWIQALARLVPANDPGLVRLQGWQLLKAGNKAGAKSKLQPIAQSDPLAAAGLVLLAENTPAEQDRSNSEARAILGRSPAGLTGASLTEMFAARGVKLVPGPLADQLAVELAKFPRELLRILDEPSRFYSLRVDPVRSALAPGDPVLVKVQIMNVNDFDLTIGNNGIIHPDLWLDAQLRGANQQVLASEAFDRITKRLVLPAGKSISQVVRLDTAQLTLMLLGQPQKFFQISAMCMTNPISIGGQISNGPGGYRVQMSKLMERTAAPFQSPQVRQKLDQTFSNGKPTDKISALELVATYYNALSGVEDPQAKEAAGPFAEAIRRATTDSDPTVRAWALYVLSLLVGEKDLPMVIRNMVQDSAWEARLLAPVVIELKAAPRQLVKPLEQDSDPLVQKLAVSVGKMPVMKPATQPAAPPTSAPVTPVTPTTPAGAPVAPRAPAPGTGAPAAPPAGPTPPPRTGATPPAGADTGVSTTPAPAGAPPAGVPPVTPTPRPSSGPSIP
jgi:tetratricopeptide (TPR) repeat protein